MLVTDDNSDKTRSTALWTARSGARARTRSKTPGKLPEGATMCLFLCPWITRTTVHRPHGETSGRGHYVFIFLAMDHAHDVSTAPFTPEQAICQIWELPKTPQTIFCQEAAPFQPPQTPEYFVSGRTRSDRVGSKLLPSLKTIDVDPPCKGVSTKAKSPPDRDGHGI
jgi:hypothetical protein